MSITVKSPRLLTLSNSNLDQKQLHDQRANGHFPGVTKLSEAMDVARVSHTCGAVTTTAYSIGLGSLKELKQELICLLQDCP